MKPPPQIEDAEIDAFIERWLPHLNPTLSAEQRADHVQAFVVALLQMTEDDKSSQWVQEFARRVRSRVLWLKAGKRDSPPAD